MATFTFETWTLTFGVPGVQQGVVGGGGGGGGGVQHGGVGGWQQTGGGGGGAQHWADALCGPTSNNRPKPSIRPSRVERVFMVGPSKGQPAAGRNLSIPAVKLMRLKNL
jgi:hypothetical protein